MRGLLLLLLHTVYIYIYAVCTACWTALWHLDALCYEGCKGHGTANGLPQPRMGLGFRVGACRPPPLHVDGWGHARPQRPRAPATAGPPLRLTTALPYLFGAMESTVLPYLFGAMESTALPYLFGAMESTALPYLFGAMESTALPLPSGNTISCNSASSARGRKSSPGQQQQQGSGDGQGFVL